MLGLRSPEQHSDIHLSASPNRVLDCFPNRPLRPACPPTVAQPPRRDAVVVWYAEIVLLETADLVAEAPGLPNSRSAAALRMRCSRSAI